MQTPKASFTPLDLQYPPQQEFARENTEKSIFGSVFDSKMPKNHFNVEKEENNLKKEALAQRKLFEIPTLNLKPLPNSPGNAAFIMSESESGISSNSVGSDIFFSENHNFLGGFIDFVKKTREIEDGQVPGSYSLSEGELRHPESEGLSTGEIPSDVFQPNSLNIERNWERLRISTSDLLSNEETFEKSEGEFDPTALFSV